MPDREKVIKALSICVPETRDDSKLECSDCPYEDVCNLNDIVGITLPLIWDILALLKEQESVVHCKDCKHWDADEHDCNIKIGWFACGADWFCADGERQEGR